ncbi:MAG: heavy metal-binding domain-containing protein [Myxococcota bacterium]|nr:heavy metal-binding domain-containing protein [Myxococcota bacterium]
MASGLLQLGIFFGLMILGYVVGRRRESAHYRRIHHWERKFRSQPAVTGTFMQPDRPIEHASLAVGSVVISVDYFKRFVAGLRALTGGEVKSFSSLIDRARREAIIRMKKSAPEADIYINVRLMTSTISGESANQSLGTVEVVAIATAIHYAP